MIKKYLQIRILQWKMYFVAKTPHLGISLWIYSRKNRINLVFRKRVKWMISYKSKHYNEFATVLLIDIIIFDVVFSHIRHSILGQMQKTMTIPLQRWHVSDVTKEWHAKGNRLWGCKCDSYTFTNDTILSGIRSVHFLRCVGMHFCIYQ